MIDNKSLEHLGINPKCSDSLTISSKIQKYFKNAYYNLCTFTYNLFIHRDSKIIVLGAWGGAKFADNSRFLYQYLFKNKEKLGLKKVIWMTRNESINQELNNLGYESYLCGSKESKYYHLKAGVHIICNSDSQSILLADIDTRYSFGSKKIQLWHGVGMKSTGPASNAVKDNTFSTRLKNWKKKHPDFYGLFHCGAWNKAYFLSTSDYNAIVNDQISLSPRNRIFISAYPRNCDCLQLLPEEKEVIGQIKDYQGAVLYLPTFRDDNSKYIHPLEYPSICSLLRDNGWVWIEKPHTADSAREKFKQRDCDIIELNSNFDINVLYKYINGLISDYSSAVFDGAYKKLPTIMYTPDLETFKNGPVGFLFDIEKYCGPLICKMENELYESISEIIQDTYLTEPRVKTLKKIRKEFFDDRESHYEEIWKDILKATGLKNKE